MFHKKRTILSVTGGTLVAEQVVLGREPKKIPLGSWEWNEETLLKTLLSVRKLSGWRVRILLGEDLAYVASVALPRAILKAGAARAAVQAKLQDLIPEALEETVWDYREAAWPRDSKVSPQDALVQVAVIPKKLFQSLRIAADHAGLTIEAIEPESSMIASLLRDEPDSFLFVSETRTPFLAVLSRGEVLISASVGAVEECLRFAKEHFGLSVSRILFSPAGKPSDVSALEMKGYVVGAITLDPVIELASKNDIRGKDQEVLNIEIAEGGRSDPLPSKKTSKWIIGWIGIGGLALLLGLLGGWVAWKEIKREKVSGIPPPEAANTLEHAAPEEPVPEEELIPEYNRASYKIAVQNGAGKSGVAVRLGELLTQEGFVVIATGNAKDVLPQTTLRSKAAVAPGFIEELVLLMKNSYTVIHVETLPDTTEEDLHIIIGKN